MASLIQHEALLEREGTPSPDDGARFHAPAHWDFPVVDLDFTRWIDMGQPDQIVVTIRPVHPGHRPPPMGMRGTVIEGEPKPTIDDITGAEWNAMGAAWLDQRSKTD